MALTALTVKQAKPKEKRYILKDDHGLYLEVSPTGGRWWRLRYWLNGKENRISLGTYPTVSLAEARDKCLEAKKLIASGEDPSKNRQQEKITKQVEAASTFKAVALSWLETKKCLVARSH